MSLRCTHKAFKFRVDIHIDRVSLAISIPYQLKIIWKRGNQKLETKKTALLDPKTNLACFGETLSMFCLLFFNEQTSSFVEKKGNKVAGVSNIDFSYFINRKTMETEEHYPLVKCPDKNAKLYLRFKFVMLSEITDNSELLSMTTDTSKADISGINESFQAAGDVTFSNLSASMVKTEEDERIVQYANNEEFSRPITYTSPLYQSNLFKEKSEKQPSTTPDFKSNGSSLSRIDTNISNSPMRPRSARGDSAPQGQHGHRVEEKENYDNFTRTTKILCSSNQNPLDLLYPNKISTMNFQRKQNAAEVKSIATPSPLVRSNFLGESPKVMRIEQQINEKNEEISQILNMMKTQNYDLSRYSKDLEKMKQHPASCQSSKADQTALEQFSNILSEKLKASQIECEQLKRERDVLLNDREELFREREIFKKEKEQLVKEVDIVRRERGEVLKERDELLRERDVAKTNLEEGRKTFKRENDALLSKVKLVELEKESLNNKLLRLEESKREMELKFSEAEGEKKGLARLSEKLKEYEKSFVSVLANLELAQEELGRMKSEHMKEEDCKKELLDQLEKYKEQLNTEREEKEEISKNYEILKQERSTHKVAVSDYERLKATMALNEERLEDMEQLIKRYEDELKRVKSKLENKRRKIDSLNKSNISRILETSTLSDEGRNKLSELEEQNQKLQRKIEVLKAKVDQHEENIKDKDRKIKKKREKTEELEEKLRLMHDDAINLKEKIENLELDKKNLKRESEKYFSICEKLKQKAKEYERRLQNLSEDADRHKELNKSSSSSYNQKHAIELDEIKTKYRALEDKYLAMESEYTKARIEWAQIDVENENIRSLLNRNECKIAKLKSLESNLAGLQKDLLKNKQNLGDTLILAQGMESEGFESVV